MDASVIYFILLGDQIQQPKCLPLSIALVIISEHFRICELFALNMEDMEETSTVSSLFASYSLYITCESIWIKHIQEF